MESATIQSAIVEQGTLEKYQELHNNGMLTKLVVNELEAEIKELKERIESVQTSILGMDEIEIIDCYGHRVKYKKIELQEIGNGG